MVTGRWLRWAGVGLAALALGCGGREAEVRGQAPTGAATSAAALRQMTTTAPVTVRGRMVEKCPIAGCWFVLEEGGERVRVDLKNAGFVVTDLPLGRAVTVSGRLQPAGNRAKRSDPEVIATGARFE